MGYIYLIEDKNNNTYKIGVTKGDPKKRLKNLQTGNSSELEIKYLFEYKFLKDFHITGRLQRV